MWGVVVHIQEMLLALGKARLPVALHSISVYLLATLHHRKVLLAWPHAVVLAIVTATRWENVLRNITGRFTFHVTRYTDLAAQQLSCHLTDGCLVHG